MKRKGENQNNKAMNMFLIRYLYKFGTLSSFFKKTQGMSLVLNRDHFTALIT